MAEVHRAAFEVAARSGRRVLRTAGAPRLTIFSPSGDSIRIGAPAVSRTVVWCAPIAMS